MRGFFCAARDDESKQAIVEAKTELDLANTLLGPVPLCVQFSAIDFHDEGDRMPAQPRQMEPKEPSATEQVRANVAAAGWRLSQDDLDAIDDLLSQPA